MPRTPSIAAALIGLLLVLALALFDADGAPPSAPVLPSLARGSDLTPAATLRSTSAAPDGAGERTPVAPDDAGRGPEPVETSGRDELVGLARTPRGRPLAGVSLEFLALPDLGTTPAQEAPRPRVVVSDAVGRFELEAPGRVQVRSVALDGHVLVAAPQPRRVADGRWAPYEVVLSPAASIELRVLDERGEGVPGVPVSVAPAETEPYSGARSSWKLKGALRAEAEGHTDEQGRLRLDGVWSEQELVLRSRALQVDRRHGRVDGERLLTGATTRGAPLVLLPGERRRLVLELAHRFVIFGRVSAASGVPLANGAVTITALEDATGSSAERTSSSVTDADGSYRIERLDAEPLRRLEVRARASGKPSGWLSTTREAGYLHSVLRFELPAVSPAEVELDLLVRPSATLAGRVVDLAGEPLERGEVRVHRAQPQPGEGIGWSRIGGDGSFRVIGLEEGLYDVQVTPASAAGEVWLRGVRAGRTDLVATVPRARACRVRVDVTSRTGVSLAEVVLLHGRLYPAGPGVEAPELAAGFVERAPQGWPTPVSSSARAAVLGDARGESEFRTWRSDGVEEIQLNSGLHWLGATGHDAEGRRLFPVGTGLVRVDAGEYEVRLELAPATALGGGVVGASDPDLALALVTEAGERVRVWDGSRAHREIHGLGATGEFRLPEVPTGAFELWVGRPDELRAGRPRLRRPIQLRPDEAATVELRLR